MVIRDTDSNTVRKTDIIDPAPAAVAWPRGLAIDGSGDPATARRWTESRGAM